MIDGRLRRGVDVTRHGGTVSLAHAFWTLDLPAEWVDSVPAMGEFLDRRVSSAALADEDPALIDLVSLLRGQGCLTYPDDRPAYRLREVRELFRHLSGSWYARYYSHPLWDRLRSGSVSRNALVAWLLYNYHLSRSAAMSASRSAVHVADPHVRAVFAESALEEYSHCEDHFFVQHPNLPLSADDVRSSVHLPSGTAFDQQMLRMAEDDWVGHTLAGLFQETTADFYDECRAFYRDVDAAYGLPGFFRNWEAHVEIDLGEGHADAFGEILDSDLAYQRDDLIRSLRNAWLTFECLYAGLDDVTALDRDDDRVLLRLPVHGGRLDPDGTALLEPFRGSLAERGTVVKARTRLELLGALDAAGVVCVPGTGSDVDFLRADLARSSLRCLSHATEHAEIILFGRLAEEAVHLAGMELEDLLAARELPGSHRALAVANFLRERATRPADFAYLLLHLYALAEPAVPLDASSVRGALSDFLGGSGMDLAGADSLINLTLRLNELHAQWVVSGDAVLQPDFFRD